MPTKPTRYLHFHCIFNCFWFLAGDIDRNFSLTASADFILKIVTGSTCLVESVTGKLKSKKILIRVIALLQSLHSRSSSPLSPFRRRCRRLMTPSPMLPDKDDANSDDAWWRQSCTSLLSCSLSDWDEDGDGSSLKPDALSRAISFTSPVPSVLRPCLYCIAPCSTWSPFPLPTLSFPRTCLYCTLLSLAQRQRCCFPSYCLSLIHCTLKHENIQDINPYSRHHFWKLCYFILKISVLNFNHCFVHNQMLVFFVLMQRSKACILYINAEIKSLSNLRSF